MGKPLTLIQYLRNRGLSTKEIASEIGVSARTVRRWKLQGLPTGRTPYADTVERLTKSTPDIKRYRSPKRVSDTLAYAVREKAPKAEFSTLRNVRGGKQYNSWLFSIDLPAEFWFETGGPEEVGDEAEEHINQATEFDNVYFRANLNGGAFTVTSDTVLKENWKISYSDLLGMISEMMQKQEYNTNLKLSDITLYVWRWVNG